MVGASGFEPPTSWSRTLGRAILQAFAGVCKLPIPCSFPHFLNDFQRFCFAPVCSRLPSLDARKGQEKGKLTQVFDSRFTHQCRLPAFHFGRTSPVRKRLGRGYPEPSEAPRPRCRATALASLQVSSPFPQHPTPCHAIELEPFSGSMWVGVRRFRPRQGLPAKPEFSGRFCLGKRNS